MGKMNKIITFLSGIYLAVFGAFQLVRLLPRYNFIMGLTPSPHHTFLAVNFGIVSTLGLLCVIIGLGLIYRQAWARSMVIVASIFSLFFGITIVVCMTWLYFMLPYGGSAVSETYTLYYWVYLLICLIIMPAFFLIFFSREKTL